MAFELIVHTLDGDMVLGFYQPRSSVEKMAAITIATWDSWSVIEVDGDARPAQVIDFAAYRAKRRTPRWPDSPTKGGEE